MTAKIHRKRLDTVEAGILLVALALICAAAIFGADPLRQFPGVPEALAIAIITLLQAVIRHFAGPRPLSNYDQALEGRPDPLRRRHTAPPPSRPNPHKIHSTRRPGESGTPQRLQGSRGRFAGPWAQIFVACALGAILGGCGAVLARGKAVTIAISPVGESGAQVDVDSDGRQRCSVLGQQATIRTTPATARRICESHPATCSWREVAE